MDDKNLNLLYNNVLNANSSEFFVELRIYVDYITSEIKFNRIRKKLENEKKNDSVDYNKVTDEVIKGCKNIYSVLNQKRRKVVPLKSTLLKFEKYLEGRIKSSTALAESLISILQNYFDKVNARSNEYTNFKKELINLNKKYWKIKFKFQKKIRFSNWDSYEQILMLKHMDTDISNLDFWEKANIGLYQKEIENIISGENELNPNKRKKYLGYLKRLNTYFKLHSDEIDALYSDDLKDRIVRYKESSKNERFFKSLILIFDFFIKEIKFVIGLILLVYAFFFVRKIYNVLRLEFLDSYIKLGIPEINTGFLFGFTLIFLFTIIILYLAKNYLIISNDIKIFYERFLNGYFLLFIYLIIIASFIGVTILKQEYGSSLRIC